MASSKVEVAAGMLGVERVAMPSGVMRRVGFCVVASA